LAAKSDLLESLITYSAGLIGRLSATDYPSPKHFRFAVDAVYLWVDDQDEAWAAKRAKYAPVVNSESSAISSSRFRQFGELVASISMLAKHAPFIRNVHIVVDGQKPDLSSLPSNLPFNIVITNHKEFMPAEYLPTFSSRALTANLHRIVGLAEHFLYMNDDVFIAMPSTASDWFTLTGVRLRYTNTALPSKESLEPDEVVYNARWKTNELAQHEKWQTIEGMPQHGPHPMLKSVMHKLWEKFPNEMKNVSAARFRTADGILPEWLHNLCALNDSKAEFGPDSGYKYIAINKKQSLAAITSMLLNRGKVLTVCLNDVSELSKREALSDARLARRFHRVLRLMV
jgi:hypothetical protein